MRRASYKAGALLVGALFLLTGCRRNNAAKTSEETTSDSALASQIEARLQQDATLKSRIINVSVQRGVATLSGQVGDDSEKASAEKLAGDVSGVKQIIDLLAVATTQTPPVQASTAGPAGATPAEQQLLVQNNPPSKPHKDLAQQAASLPPIVENPPSSEQGQSNLPPVIEKPPSTSDQQAGQGPAPVVNNPPPPPPPVRITIPAGTDISVRMIDAINSGANQAGQTFVASVATSVIVDNRQVIPQGSPAQVRVAEVTKGNRLLGHAGLELELAALTIHGTSYSLQSGDSSAEGASRKRASLKKCAAGAIGGAIVGVILGKGKGAAIGGGAGCGGGLVWEVASKGPTASVPPETLLNFQLEAPLSVPIPPGPNQ